MANDECMNVHTELCFQIEYNCAQFTGRPIYLTRFFSDRLKIRGGSCPLLPSSRRYAARRHSEQLAPAGYLLGRVDMTERISY